jgi:hypothetical protein
VEVIIVIGEDVDKQDRRGLIKERRPRFCVIEHTQRG